MQRTQTPFHTEKTALHSGGYTKLTPSLMCEFPGSPNPPRNTQCLPFPLPLRKPFAFSLRLHLFVNSCQLPTKTPSQERALSSLESNFWTLRRGFTSSSLLMAVPRDCACQVQVFRTALPACSLLARWA